MDVHFWRQLLMLVTGAMGATSAGFMTAFPGVLNPSLLSPNATDIKATVSEASWLAACNPIAGILGFIFLPIIMQTFGRKVTNIIINLLMLTGWVIFFFAKNLATLFVARIIQGVDIGSLIVLSITISEYCDPKRRGYFMVIKKIASGVGVLLCHVLALFWSWRRIAGFCVTFNVIGILATLFWPESPAFLARKGRFEDCEQSFVWLFGNNTEKMKELTDLIATQEKLINKRQDTKLESLLKIDFLKGFVIAVLLAVVIESSGRHYLPVYIIQILMELIQDKSRAIYFSIGNDCLTIIGLFLAGITIRLLKRRTILFAFGVCSVLFLLSISIIIYLKPKFAFLANSGWWSMFMILFFNFLECVSVIPLAFTLLGEIFSLEHKGLGMSIVGIALSCTYSSTLKLLPIIIKNLGLSAIFLISAVCFSFSLIILYFILPETKDKTLQNIEFEMKGIQRPSKEVTPMIAD